MRHSFLFVVVILTILTTRAAAQGLIVKGKVTDTNDSPVQFATALLLQAGDTSQVKAMITNEAGEFEFKGVETGSYILKTSFLGFKPYRKTFSLKTTDTALAVSVIMAADDIAIKEVSVVGSRPHIIQKEDRVVVDLANTTLASGHNALEVLEKAPGVYINPKNESISLNGKGVTVTIDGKKTYLATADLAVLMKSFQSSDIEQVELITNPGAKHDAEGTGGIINIITKKGKLEGTKGSVNIGAGYTTNSRQSGGLSLQHKKGKVVLAGSYNIMAKQYKTLDETTVNYLHTADQSITNQYLSSGVNLSETVSHSYRSSLDWTPNKYSNLNLSFRGFNFDKEKEGSAVSRITDLASSSASDMRITNTVKANNQQYAGSLNYSQQFTPSKAVSIGLDYSNYSSSERNHIANLFTVDPEETNLEGVRLRNSLPVDIRIFSGKVDYEQPLWKGKLEAGAKYSNIQTDNDARYELLQQDQSWKNDTLRTNYFSYLEEVTAAYITYKNSFSKFNYRIGVRAEYTASKGDLVSSNQINSQEYLDLFPSLLVSKVFAENHFTSLSYSRRLRRPNYQDLNPFIYFQDMYNYSQGNPFLSAEYTTSLDLRYAFKNTYNVALSYSDSKGGISYITRRDIDNPLVIYTAAENIDHQRQLLLNISIPFSPAPWCDIYNTINGSYFSNSTSYSSAVEKSIQGFAGTFGMSSYFKIKGWQPNISGYFQSAAPYGLITLRSQYQVNLGLQKKFLHDNLTMRASYNDIFQSARAYAELNFASVRGNSLYKWDSNYFQLSLSYNFGNQKVKVANNNRKESDEENRIKQ